MQLLLFCTLDTQSPCIPHLQHKLTPAQGFNPCEHQVSASTFISVYSDSDMSEAQHATHSEEN